jgi:predicted outer membrane repeat protein
MPNGGAIKVQFGGKLVIINSTFEENEAAQAGGAISIQANTGMNNLVAIINSTFDNNKAQAGGAISSLQNVGNSLVAIFGSDFTENSATQVGGAVYLDDLSAVIVNASNFTDNYAAEKGGAINALGDLIVAGSEFENNAAELGGAIYVSDKYAAVKLDVDESVFTLNSACNAGGAICIDATNGKGITYSIDDSEFTGNYIDCDGTCPAVAGAAVFTEGNATGTIDGSNFTGNSAIVEGVASNGGAVKVQFGGTSIITDCTFTGNEAEKGGAIDAQADKDRNNNVTVEGCTFTDNYATQAGGAICGLQYYGQSTLTVKDSTFVNNAAGLVGGAIYADDLTIASITDSYFSGNEDVTNGIFNINFYKLAEGSVVANNTFDIDLVNITTDKGTYAYGENVNVSGDFDWGVNKIPINVTFALYRNGEKLADIDTELTGTSFAEVLEGLLPGTYVASVDSFTEDVYGNYYNITVVAAAEFVIEKANATINVTVGDNKRFAYGDNVTVFIELYSNVTGEGLTANVTVVINDTAMIVEVINGTASFNVSGYEPEHYALVGEFAGDDCYNGPIYGSDVFTVLRPDRILSIETMDTVYGEPTFITIRVTDYEGNEEQGIVVLNISGSEMAVVVNGTAIVELLPNATGLYLVNATLVETDLDAAIVNDTETFTVYDNPLVIIDAIANITITYGENDVVVITPAFTLDLENIIEGNATIKVYNIKDLTAEVIENINNLNVTLADIINYIENFDITATPERIITDIAVGKDGAVVDVPGLNAGAYLMVVNFTSSNYYFGEAITGTVVLPAEADVNITATSVVYGEDVIVTVTATGVNGELLNGTVAYYIDGVDKVYGVISVENGTGSLGITYLLDADEYAIYSVFVEEHVNYIDVNSISRFTVYPAVPTLSVVADDVLYTETPVINITLSGVDGLGIAGETLIIDVSGMTYVGVTDENGTVQVIIDKVLPIDTYNITVEFGGNNNYLAYVNDTESFKVSNNNNLTFTIGATSVAYPEMVVFAVVSEVDGTATVYVANNDGYSFDFTIEVKNHFGIFALPGLVPAEYQVNATYEAYGYNATEGETEFTVVKGATD